MTKMMNPQLHELLKAYLSSAGNSCSRDLKGEMESIVTVFNANMEEIKPASFV